MQMLVMIDADILVMTDADILVMTDADAHIDWCIPNTHTPQNNGVATC